MSGSTSKRAHTVIGGVTFFTSIGGKALALYPRIPREQFNYIVDASKDKGLAKTKELLKAESTARVADYVRDFQAMQLEQHKIMTFERVKFSAQRGATALYRKALTVMIAAGRDELKSRNAVAEQEELFAGIPATAEVQAATVAAEPDGSLEDGFAAFAAEVQDMAVTA